MNSTDYENRILDAIETITTNAINKAGYDRTIQATIVESVDSGLGKYIVKYQDSEFEAYSNNIDIYYPSGTLVNILVPNGDFNLDKIIISAKDKNQIEYTNIIEEEERYQNDSGNAISSTQEFGLCSYKEKDVCILYDKETNENNINLNVDFIEKNIENKDSILCGAEFKTDLDLSQQKQGNYGLVFDIDFLNNSTGEIITKSFVLDINQMKGNPYNLSSYVRQYKIFKINIDNFVAINKIYLFSENFLLQENEKPNDIFIKNFELRLLNEIDTETLNVYNIEIQTKDKKYFDEYDPDTAEIQFNAKLQYKGQNITDDNIKFYWFKENVAINSNSTEYYAVGGAGWECLNQYNDTEDKRYYVDSNVINITKAMILSQNLAIKCVAVKNDKIIATEFFTIDNYGASYKLSIVSEEGDVFYFDNGHPTIRCLINNEDVLSNNLDTYTYTWGYIDSDNIYHQLEETTEENLIYNTAMSEYQELLARIESGLSMAAVSQEELDRLSAIINKHNQRVEGNIIHDIDLTKIIDTAIFKCAVVKNNSILLGTASFTITNKKETEGEYFLDILNGTQSFHYTINGIAPTNSSLNNPLVLEPLKIILYNNNGQIITGDALNECRIQWIVPKEDTLIIAKDSTEPTLAYELADNYDENKLYNNNIELTVFYKGLFLKKKTTFTFTKDGEPGTNGTDIVCKIVPNAPSDENYENNCYPMIVNGNFNFGCLNYERSENYSYYNTDKWFKVELWQDGKPIYSEVDSTEDLEISWSVLRNRYNNLKIDETSINITKDENGYHFSDLGYKENGANIVKAEVLYNGVLYYAMLPLITVELVHKEENYTIELKRNTGFRYVKYSDDGRFPLYSTSMPFTIQVTKNIEGYIEDISLINNEYTLTYQWSRCGKLFNYAIGAFMNNYNFIIVEDNNLAKNQKFLKPDDVYDGQNVTNALEVKISNMNNEEIGKIHIPLYLYLDKYRHAALNGWDGNSISLNEEGGIILAPQVGAGHKELDNTFTGLLMGSVREEGKDVVESGLLGYHHGDKTLFLDSNTGRAEFGRVGTGQIIIDPGTGTGLGDSKALIYGGNYIEQDLEHEEKGSGLLIDLAKPEIKFGNKKFIVDSTGRLNAAEVNLTGEIQALSGTFGNGVDKIKIGENTEVEYSYIYSGNKVNIDAKSSGFYLGTNGFAFGNPGDNDNESPFKVTVDGILTATSATIKGDITAETGRIGNWHVDNGAIFYRSDTASEDQEDMDSYISYLNADGSVKFGNFKVAANGSVSTTGMSLNDGSIILKGSDAECRNGLIVGDFSFNDAEDKANNARNCVGKDAFIARGAGAVGSFYYTKIVPDKITLSNKTGTRKLEFNVNDDTSGNVAMLLTAPDNYTSIQIKRGNDVKTSLSATEIYAPTVRSTSCESKKKNITPDTGCLQEILNTDIMNFNFNYEKDNEKKHVGLIIPDKGGPYHCSEKVIAPTGDSIDIASAVMMTWKALQEMQAQINEIKGE